MSNEKIHSEFMVNRVKDNPFVDGGLRVYREYRDLGVGKATNGKIRLNNKVKAMVVK